MSLKDAQRCSHAPQGTHSDIVDKITQGVFLLVFQGINFRFRFPPPPPFAQVVEPYTLTVEWSNILFIFPEETDLDWFMSALKLEGVPKWVHLFPIIWLLLILYFSRPDKGSSTEGPTMKSGGNNSPLQSANNSPGTIQQGGSNNVVQNMTNSPGGRQEINVQEVHSTHQYIEPSAAVKTSLMTELKYLKKTFPTATFSVKSTTDNQELAKVGEFLSRMANSASLGPIFDRRTNTYIGTVTVPTLIHNNSSAANAFLKVVKGYVDSQVETQKGSNPEEIILFFGGTPSFDPETGRVRIR